MYIFFSFLVLGCLVALLVGLKNPAFVLPARVGTPSRGKVALIYVTAMMLLGAGEQALEPVEIKQQRLSEEAQRQVDREQKRLAAEAQRQADGEQKRLAAEAQRQEREAQRQAERAKREAEEAERKRVGSQFDAEVTARQFVLKRLKAPSTAKFVEESSMLPRDGTWLVVGAVDSQNSFGAMLRTQYTCGVRHVGGWCPAFS